MDNWGLPQHSPAKYFAARKEIESQKFPVVVNAMMSQGITSIDATMPIIALVMGYLGVYLSLIIPPIRAEQKPILASESAFILANASLNPG